MCSNKKNLKAQSEQGFTLVELMIAVALAGFIVSQMYLVFISNKKSSISQERVAEMQQNLRATMYPLVRDIRMAGYDPSGDADWAGIVQAAPGRIDMYMDMNGNGTYDAAAPPGMKERLQFGFPAATDADDDGIPDDGSSDSIGVQTSGAGGYQPIGDDIESFEFLYLDGDGQPSTTLSEIRSVQISLLAITNKADRDYTNNQTYDPASGINANWKRAANTDNFRRRLLITTVFCRNLGL